MYDHENIPPYERTDKYALIRTIIEAHDDNQDLMEDWAEAWLNTWPYGELKKIADEIRGSVY
jgi:hypothetical protein